MNPYIYSEKTVEKKNRLHVSLSFAQCFSHHALLGHRSSTENDLLLNTFVMGKPVRIYWQCVLSHRVED